MVVAVLAVLMRPFCALLCFALQVVVRGERDEICESPASLAVLTVLMLHNLSMNAMGAIDLWMSQVYVCGTLS